VVFNKIKQNQDQHLYKAGLVTVHSIRQDSNRWWTKDRKHRE